MSLDKQLSCCDNPTDILVLNETLMSMRRLGSAQGIHLLHKPAAHNCIAFFACFESQLVCGTAATSAVSAR